jgi:hypothetical protein
MLTVSCEMKWPAYTNRIQIGVVDRCFVGLNALPKSLKALTGVFIIDTN